MGIRGTPLQLCFIPRPFHLRLAVPLSPLFPSLPPLLSLPSLPSSPSLSLFQTGQVLGKVTGSVRTQLIAHDKEVQSLSSSLPSISSLPFSFPSIDHWCAIIMSHCVSCRFMILHSQNWEEGETCLPQWDLMAQLDSLTSGQIRDPHTSTC